MDIRNKISSLKVVLGNDMQIVRYKMNYTDHVNYMSYSSATFKMRNVTHFVNKQLMQVTNISGEENSCSLLVNP